MVLMNKNEVLKEITLKYFELFSSKNINLLSKLFAVDISLRDWEINESGLENVKNACLKIFNNVEKLDINPLQIVISNNTAFCEIDIIINSKELIKVVDIVDFDKNNLIRSIKAFKG